MPQSSIKTNGVSPELPQNPVYFTEISIADIMKIPPQKPDMEQAVSVTVEARVTSKRIVDTECAKSIEGQLLTGKKLVMELKLIQKVIYIADKPTQPAHAFHDEETRRSVFIIVPKFVNGIEVERLLKTNKLIVTPYIEDIYAEQMDNRTIFKNITLLIDVTAAC